MWRVEQVNLDGRVRLCVKYGKYFVKDCDTAPEALDLLDRHGVTIDQLTAERESAGPRPIRGRS